MVKEINSNKHNTNTEVPVTALMSLIATGTIGIVLSASLFVLLFIYYHKCYKVKAKISQDDLESKGSILRLRGKRSVLGGRR